MRKEERDIRKKIIDVIEEQNKRRFRVFDNTGPDKQIIAGQFPDMIFKQSVPPPNDNVLFVLKIEVGENLLDSISIWKDLGSAPSVFYIIIAKEHLDKAKKLANATGVRARFAWYELSKDKGKVENVFYE